MPPAHLPVGPGGRSRVASCAVVALALQFVEVQGTYDAWYVRGKREKRELGKERETEEQEAKTTGLSSSGPRVKKRTAGP